MSLSPRLKSEHGFTIIEVMVAAVILLVGILGVTTMVNTANSTTTSNKAREQGLALARELIESARSVRYQALRPSTIVSSLQAMPGLSNSGGGAGWTIKRRGIVYSVAVGVCSVDDPSDTTGAHTANTFCQRSSVQASSSTCKSLLGTPAKINGSGGAGGADAGDCGLDTNLDGQVDNLLQTSASSCPSGTSVAAGTCDDQPDDFKRLVVLVVWDRGTGNRYVLQQATMPFPGLSAYGAITSLTLQGYAAGSNGYTVGNDANTDKPGSLTFNGTSSQSANQVDWLLNGTDQGQANWSGTSGSFTWNLGNNAPESETTPASGEVLDGTYLVGARVQDAGGIHGTEMDVAVKLNRRVPFPPPTFSIAGAAFDSQNRPTQVVASWSAPPDGDVIGYTLWRQVSGTWSQVSGCTQLGNTVRTCTDSNPPGNTSVGYRVDALDNYPVSGAVRDGQFSPTRTITVGNIPPTVPGSFTVQPNNGANKVVVTWTTSTDPDDALDYYELTRVDTSTGTKTVFNPGSGATSYTDATVTRGATYTWYMRAKDVNGGWSDYTSQITMTVTH